VVAVLLITQVVICQAQVVQVVAGRVLLQSLQGKMELPIQAVAVVEDKD
jgi:hypothetical protein